MAREEGGEGPQMELGQKHEKTKLPPSHGHSPQGKQRGAGDKGGERKAEREGAQPTGLCWRRGHELGPLSGAFSMGPAEAPRGKGESGTGLYLMRESYLSSFLVFELPTNRIEEMKTQESCGQ